MTQVNYLHKQVSNLVNEAHSMKLLINNIDQLRNADLPVDPVIDIGYAVIRAMKSKNEKIQEGFSGLQFALGAEVNRINELCANISETIEPEQEQ